MQLQAKEHLEPPEAGRDKEGSSPRAFGRSVGLPTPGLQTSGLQIQELINCVVLSHPVHGNLLQQPQDTNPQSKRMGSNSFR